MGEYTYDLRVVRERATYLRSALPGATILYAVKANGHPAVVDALAEICDGLDVASTGELALAAPGVARALAGRGVGRVIVVPPRLVNIVPA